MPELNTELKRSTRNRWFMGVCGGIAHEFGWNPKAVRAATVVLAIAIPGAGIPLALAIYIALGLLLPKSEEF
jgi:phage shock protein PspC (stress-responsive transcriptional regulator)